MLSRIASAEDVALERIERERGPGDEGWSDLLGRHHAIVRPELDRFGGDEIDTAGNRFLRDVRRTRTRRRLRPNDL